MPLVPVEDPDLQKALDAMLEKQTAAAPPPADTTTPPSSPDDSTLHRFLMWMHNNPYSPEQMISRGATGLIGGTADIIGSAAKAGYSYATGQPAEDYTPTNVTGALRSAVGTKEVPADASDLYRALDTAVQLSMVGGPAAAGGARAVVNPNLASKLYGAGRGVVGSVAIPIAGAELAGAATEAAGGGPRARALTEPAAGILAPWAVRAAAPKIIAGVTDVAKNAPEVARAAEELGVTPTFGNLAAPGPEGRMVEKRVLGERPVRDARTMMRGQLENAFDTALENLRAPPTSSPTMDPYLNAPRAPGQTPSGAAIAEMERRIGPGNTTNITPIMQALDKLRQADTTQAGYVEGRLKNITNVLPPDASGQPVTPTAAVRIPYSQVKGAMGEIGRTIEGGPAPPTEAAASQIYAAGRPQMQAGAARAGVDQPTFESLSDWYRRNQLANKLEDIKKFGYTEASAGNTAEQRIAKHLDALVRGGFLEDVGGTQSPVGNVPREIQNLQTVLPTVRYTTSDMGHAASTAQGIEMGSLPGKLWHAITGPLRSQYAAMLENPNTRNAMIAKILSQRGEAVPSQYRQKLPFDELYRALLAAGIGRGSAEQMLNE